MIAHSQNYVDLFLKLVTLTLTNSSRQIYIAISKTVRVPVLVACTDYEVVT